MALASRVALITGAASGLGLAVAARFVRLGARVVLVDLPTSAGAKAAQELHAENAAFAAADVTNEAEINAALDVAKSRFGREVNTLVNCAGIAPPAKVLGRNGPHALELFLKVLQVNTAGTFNTIRLASARMAATEPDSNGERGAIVNTASVAAFDGQIGQAAYSASKGAVVAMTLPIARELAAHGIRVNTIAPGIMATPMMAGLPQKAQDTLGQLVPFPARMGKPDEYAMLVQHMIENTYLNGEVVRLDGSLRMPGK